MAYVVALKQWVADQLAAKAAAVHGHTLDETTDTATRLALTPGERTKLANTSGTNTGDQTLPTWSTISGKPAVVAAGATQADARTAIGAGTSSLAIGTTSATAAAGNHAHTGVYAPALGADDNYVTDTEKAALHSHSNKTALDLVSGTNTGDQDLSGLVTLGTAQTVTGAKTVTAPTMVAATPAAVFGPDLTPAAGLSAWTLAGGATWVSPNLTIPSGGSVSCTISVTAGRIYQIDLTRSASGGGDLTVSIGTATVTVPSSATVLTVVAAATGSLTLTVGGGTWTATVQTIVCREATPATAAFTAGAAQLRASGSNSAIGGGAQQSLTTGGGNNATGGSAQQSLTTGSNNSAIGYRAQYALTTGDLNSAVGYRAQYALTTGSFNSALGPNAQYGLTSGSFNSAVGPSVQAAPRGVSAWATTTASRQTSIGHESGQGSAAQSNDIVTVGYRAVADGAKAMSLGSQATAAHAGSVALGSDVATTSTGQVAVGPRDVEVQDATKGVVLRSPDGSRWRVTVNDTGALATTKIV